MAPMKRLLPLFLLIACLGAALQGRAEPTPQRDLAQLRQGFETTSPVAETSSLRRLKHRLAPLPERLKALAEAQDVPPYVIFHDATLLDMVHLRPTNPDQFLLINGVGQSKLHKYGAEFLRIIKNYEASIV